MKREIEYYDHLNNDDPEGGIVVKLPLDEVAKQVLGMNYGLSRFLSALKRAVDDPKNARLAHLNKDEVYAIVKTFEELPR